MYKLFHNLRPKHLHTDLRGLVNYYNNYHYYVIGIPTHGFYGNPTDIFATWRVRVEESNTIKRMYKMLFKEIKEI